MFCLLQMLSFSLNSMAGVFKGGLRQSDSLDCLMEENLNAYSEIIFFWEFPPEQPGIF